MTHANRVAPTLLLDEHVWEGLAALLRGHGFDVVHVNEVQRSGLSDEEQLGYAAENSRAILTFNARHFEPLAAKWFFAEREHAGIIISNELPIGELQRRAENLLNSRSADELKNTVHWLHEYR